MNVIVTAREKTKYKEGSFMVAMGETFDGEKSLPYMFDTIVRMYVDDKGRHMGTCLKDRSNKLPNEEFECSYQVFEQFFGKQSLNRASKPIEYATEEQKSKNRGDLLLVVVLKGLVPDPRLNHSARWRYLEPPQVTELVLSRTPQEHV
jgi:hypothetical protein